MGTVREEIAELIRQESLSAIEISKLIGVREKDVYEHLQHIARTALRKEIFHLEPSKCMSCGYIFRDRKKLTRPGRCHRCRGQRITRPYFSLKPITRK